MTERGGLRRNSNSNRTLLCGVIGLKGTSGLWVRQSCSNILIIRWYGNGGSNGKGMGRCTAFCYESGWFLFPDHHPLQCLMLFFSLLCI